MWGCAILIFGNGHNTYRVRPMGTLLYQCMSSQDRSDHRWEVNRAEKQNRNSYFNRCDGRNFDLDKAARTHLKWSRRCHLLEFWPSSHRCLAGSSVAPLIVLCPLSLPVISPSPAPWIRSAPLPSPPLPPLSLSQALHDGPGPDMVLTGGQLSSVPPAL